MINEDKQTTENQVCPFHTVHSLFTADSAYVKYDHIIARAKKVGVPLQEDHGQWTIDNQKQLIEVGYPHIKWSFRHLAFYSRIRFL